MTATYQPPGDSGTQPQPHYCTSRARGDGTMAGCPLWPDCLFSTAGQPEDAAETVEWERLKHRRAVEPATPRPQENSLADDLAPLIGWAAGAVVFLVVAAILLPLFL
jgi:hypothetical protein